MTGDPIVWTIAGLEVATATGITVFWATWFRRPHDQPWLPAGFVDHEAPFVFSDSLLALVLLAAAALQLFEESAGDSLGLIAAGMLLFLGVLDLAYFARTGLLAREHEGLANIGVVASVLILSVVLIVRFF